MRKKSIHLLALLQLVLIMVSLFNQGEAVTRLINTNTSTVKATAVV